MSRTIRIENLDDAVSELLEEYADVTAETLKTAVNNAGNLAKKEIQATAPKQTGQYAKSWKARKTRETSTNYQVTVYSSSRYRLAHLLEHGHAKRNGGRVRAFPHIAPAEEKAEDQLLSELERRL